MVYSCKQLSIIEGKIEFNLIKNSNDHYPFRAQGLKLRYKFWLTNGEPWDFLHHQYSADEFYILPILTVYLLFHLVLLCITFSHAVQLKSRQLLHTTFKLFWFSVLLHTGGLALSTFNYFAYGMNGYGAPTAKLTGRVLESAGEIAFLLLLILLAKVRSHWHCCTLL